MTTTTLDEPAESTALAVIERGSPMPVFTGEEMGRAFGAYRELQHALDRAMPDQIQAMGDRSFRKKGYWRALRTAFNLSVECLTERREALADDDDWGWLVTYRATAPNGKHADGDGACAASEKSRGRMTATEHNVRSHAHTRAFNRAVSNLVGFGEVSAEEVEDEDAPTPPPAKAARSRPVPVQAPAPEVPAAPSGVPPTAVVSVVEKVSNAGTRWYLVTFSDGVQAGTQDEALADQASELAQSKTPVRPALKAGKEGRWFLNKLTVVKG